MWIEAKQTPMYVYVWWRHEPQSHNLHPLVSSPQYKVDVGELRSRTLNLSVWHAESLGRNVFLGEVEVSLGLWDWSYTQPLWQDLQPRVGGPGPAPLTQPPHTCSRARGAARAEGRRRHAVNFNDASSLCNLNPPPLLPAARPPRSASRRCLSVSASPPPPPPPLQVHLSPDSISSRGTIVLSIKFIPDGSEGEQRTQQHHQSDPLQSPPTTPDTYVRVCGCVCVFKAVVFL